MSADLPRLLYADDNVDAVRFGAIAMRNEFVCDEAYTVESTVVKLTHGRFDVVLLDLTFDGEHFEHTAMLIASIPNLPPIVVLTGRDLHMLGKVRELLNPYACLKKPTEKDVIVNALRAAMAFRRQQDLDRAGSAESGR